MERAITITRDDQANYIIKCDTDGPIAWESLESALDHVRQILIRQDARIANFRSNPSAWIVEGISELPS